MKKIIFVLLFILPIVANAQKVSNSPPKTEKKSIKYEDVISKFGTVFTKYTYQIDGVELISKSIGKSVTNKLDFSIEKVVVGNIGISYLNIRHTKYDETSSVMIEESNVKELYSSLIKMKELGKNPVPNGATAEHYYLNSDGIVIKYSAGYRWEIQLERFSKDTIWVTDIDPLIAKLKEIIQKMASIK